MPKINRFSVIEGKAKVQIEVVESGKK